MGHSSCALRGPRRAAGGTQLLGDRVLGLCALEAHILIHKNDNAQNLWIDRLPQVATRRQCSKKLECPESSQVTIAPVSCPQEGHAPSRGSDISRPAPQEKLPLWVASGHKNVCVTKKYPDCNTKISHECTDRRCPTSGGLKFATSQALSRKTNLTANGVRPYEIISLFHDGVIH